MTLQVTRIDAWCRLCSEALAREVRLAKCGVPLAKMGDLVVHFANDRSAGDGDVFESSLNAELHIPFTDQVGVISRYLAIGRYGTRFSKNGRECRDSRSFFADAQRVREDED